MNGMDEMRTMRIVNKNKVDTFTCDTFPLIGRSAGVHMAARPHTVPVPAYFRSEPILKILQEIENEARGPLAKTRPPQKNHLQENVRRLKEIEARHKMAQRQPLKAHKAPMPEKSLPRLEPPRTAGAPRPLHPSRSLPQISQPFDVSSQESESIRSDSASHVSCRSKQKTKSEVKHRPGQIPNYLVERRRQWEEAREEERRREEVAAVVPEGYSLLPDEERLETLELLKKNRDELVQSLSSLPVRNDTLRLRRCREELEKQLAKVDEGLKIFAKPKVLIKHDT
ncbi:hypothetical protein JTE90_017429 [Oedothorax gibbosus]|uniref:Enkurin domain-containing protein n=1 Tax=Oedothorax gibbosus TaxID=931172 RepID=A0AAV6U753_9ARAC|nr:hypothetical protein JTE90_017429 [Oedothorax gibbosus]